MRQADSLDSYVSSFSLCVCEVAEGLHNMGNLSYRQGDYETAEELYKRSVAIKEHILGRQHPGTGVLAVWSRPAAFLSAGGLRDCRVRV